jgi:nitroimidazol reductase NimA-like FMN-containing flavoprotein (pyridoxamine 5'-phosphate oxidase superfamily)
MRRSDREIKDMQEIFGILKKCDSLRLGINPPDYPYVVPVNFGVELDGQSITLWFHSAPEGLKLDLIKQDPHVGFEADCSRNLIAGDKACYYSMSYESVIGFGNICVCNDNGSKLRGLNAIMCHYVPEENFKFSDSELDPVCVLRLDVTQITGKRIKSVVTDFRVTEE